MLQQDVEVVEAQATGAFQIEQIFGVAGFAGLVGDGGQAGDDHGLGQSGSFEVAQALLLLGAAGQQLIKLAGDLGTVAVVASLGHLLLQAGGLYPGALRAAKQRHGHASLHALEAGTGPKVAFSTGSVEALVADDALVKVAHRKLRQPGGLGHAGFGAARGHLLGQYPRLGVGEWQQGIS